MAVKQVSTSTERNTALNIAVDVGRSSLKAAVADRVISFPFLVATKKAATADYYVASDKIQKMAEVDGKFYLFGEEATLFGDSVVQHTEGEAFRKASIAATIFTAAYMMCLKNRHSSKVNLAINLTFDNHYQKELYAKELKGKHKVHFLKEDETYEFEIDRVFVLYQGFSGLISVAMDDSFKIDKNYVASEGVVVDVGRQTIDFLYVERFVVKSGLSKDFGTFKVYEKVVDLLKRKYQIIKEPYEIEEHITASKPISLLDGTKIDLAPLVKEAVAFYFDDVILHFQTFLGKKTPDYLLLLGGGARAYGPFFEDKFKIVTSPDTPEYANARGMLKFLTRAVMK